MTYWIEFVTIWSLSLWYMVTESDTPCIHSLVFDQVQWYFSCRAMVCKNGGRCEVTVVNRKCRRCRYDRCLGAGMNPSAVLDDDGKKVRFRKMLKKKMLQPEEVRTSELTKAG